MKAHLNYIKGEIIAVSIRTKIVLITIGILFVALAANTAVSSAIFTREYSEALQSEAAIVSQSLKFQLDRLLKLNIPLHEIVGFEKQCQDIVNGYDHISYAMVVDVDGRILFHNDPAQQGQLMPNSVVEKATQTVNSLAQIYTLNGVDYYDVSVPVFNAHDEQIATVRTGFPVELVTQQTKNMVVYSVGIFAGSFLLAVVSLVLALSVWVTNPLGRLVNAIQAIREQGTETVNQVTIHSQDEIGHLASVFNEMVSDLRESHEEINRYTQELESKVAERTATLNELNAALQHDLEERERMEIALKAFTAKLKQSNQELEQFAYAASHDLQAPLRKVITFGDRLKANYADVLDERGLDYVTRMQNASERMFALVEGLLNYSRITTKARPFTEVDLAQIAHEVISDLEWQIEQVDGQVIIGELPKIEADPLQMRQLLQNLVSNGLKFHQETERPFVRIEAQILNGIDTGAMAASSAAQLCRLTVTDNGIGFEEKYMDSIFQVFHRLHGRSEYEGTGIGLATCRKIAQRHSGDITAKSYPGEGATFIVTLPVKQNTPETV